MIASRELLASWLYGVAHRTALKAKASAAKRKRKERPMAEMPEPEAALQDRWHDLLPLLDQALSNLPDKYRVAIILCDLEGKTRKEAARQLGCPEGTVAGRLARARTMLAKRLARHGVEISGASLAVMLSENAVSAGVPISVVSSTIEAASLFAAGQAAATGAISAKVAALTEGVLKAMLLTKLKVVTVVFLGVSIVGVSTGRWLDPVKGAGPVIARQEGETKSEPTLPGKKAVPDKDKIQGRWQVSVDEAEKDKQLFLVDEFKSSKFTVSGEKFVWELKSKKVKGTIRLNEKTKTFGLSYEGDGVEGEYRVDGDSVELLGKVAYRRNKVLPGSPPNPIVLKRSKKK